MQNGWKKALGIAMLFFATFLFGWQIARWRQGTAVDTMSSLQTQAENWGLGFGAEGTQPTGTVSAEELKQYDAYYVGDKEEKVIYLTFDCGYDKGQIRLYKGFLKNSIDIGFFYFDYIEKGGEEWWRCIMHLKTHVG